MGCVVPDRHGWLGPHRFEHRHVGGRPRAVFSPVSPLSCGACRLKSLEQHVVFTTIDSFAAQWVNGLSAYRTLRDSCIAHSVPSNIYRSAVGAVSYRLTPTFRLSSTQSTRCTAAAFAFGGRSSNRGVSRFSGLGVST